MRFRNRDDAGKQLAAALVAYRGRNPLVLGIPRGAVPMARVIAEALEGELDVMLVRKLRAPDQPELAVGAIDEQGDYYLHPYAQQLDLTDEYLQQEMRFQLKTLRERRRQYTPARAAIDPKGRVVIVVDDGIATGSTMTAALHAIRDKGPAQLVVATAVAPPDTLERLKVFADEVVSLQTPAHFQSVGEFFEDFNQVSDEEVIALLHPK